MRSRQAGTRGTVLLTDPAASSPEGFAWHTRSGGLESWLAAFDDDTIREIAKALHRHVERVPLERVINDLFEVRGDKRFRDTIEKLHRAPTSRRS